MSVIDWNAMSTYDVTPEKVVDVLRTARSRLEKPQNWARNAGVRDADPEKCTYCILTALSAHGTENLDNYYSRTAAATFLTVAVNEINGHSTDIVEWNDRIAPDHASILETYDRAIASVERDIQERKEEHGRA